jgi:general secretion pathway protein A
MYQDFFGLRELPFELTTDTRFLFLPPKYREAMSVLRYGVMARKGLTVLTGDAGLGKTTLIRAAFEVDLKAGARLVAVSNPALTRSEFFECVGDGFKLSAAARESKTVLLRELEGRLAGMRANRVATALILDEAQSLPSELLEEIRLLSNMEMSGQKLLPIVLVGQPELAMRLNDPALRQFKQRVALRCHLASFTLLETTTYIATRLRAAGGNGAVLFTREAIALVHQRSRGIPRTINVICDNALVTGFAAEQRLIEVRIVREVCRDFDFDLHTQAVMRGDDGAADGAATPIPAARAVAAAVGTGAGAPAGPVMAGGVLFGSRAPEPWLVRVLSSRPWRGWGSRAGDA